MNETQKARPDSALLHFIKEIPDRYLLFGLSVLMIGVWAASRDRDILQLLVMLVGAVIALSTKKNMAPDQTIKAETIETDQMDNANIVTKSVTTGDKAK